MPSSSSPTASSQSENGDRHSAGSSLCTATTNDELVGFNSNLNSTSSAVADVINTADIYEGVLIYVFNFLSQQEELRELTVVSKHFYKIVHYGDEEDESIRTRRGIEWKLIKLFELTPTKGAKITTFVDNMHRHSLNNDTMDTLQNYHRMRVNGVNMFIDSTTSTNLSWTEIVGKLRGIRMEGIRTIDTTLQIPAFAREPYIFFAIAYMDLPNLREIIFSNIADSNYIITRFSQTFPLLETISICNGFESSSLDDDDYSLRGYSMQRCNNLRSISMNDCDFYSRDIDQLSDLTRHDDVYIFHDCFSRNTNLERISIHGIRYSTFTTPATNHDIPQNALIKLVRNAPASLKWFRSDLTPENISMLQTERDELGKTEIELLN